MRITAKGQVTIPRHIRATLGLLPGTEVELEVDGDEVRLKKAASSTSRGKRLVEHMRGRLVGGMGTDELMILTRGPSDDFDDDIADIADMADIDGVGDDAGSRDIDGDATDRP